MRRALILFVLLFPSTALADPIPATGWKLEELPLGLARPSGLAWSNGLVATDLATGRVVRVHADGSLRDLTKPLPIGVDVMGQPTGPYKVKELRCATWVSRFLVTQGWPDANALPAETDHALLVVQEDKTPTVISGDFWNPYDFEVRCFPVGGLDILVVDAGKNALMRIVGDKTEVIYEFPRLKRDADQMSELSPTEFAQGAEPYEVDAVPTGIAIRDDRVWVALFGGFPFTPDGGAVVSLPLEGEGAVPRAEIDGLNTPIDVEFTPAGDLLVLEMGMFDMASGFVPGTGALSIIDLATSARRELLTGLDQPAGLLAASDDEIYVSALSGHVYRLTRAQ